MKLFIFIGALSLSGCALDDSNYREQLRGAMLYNGLQMMHRSQQSATSLSPPVDCWRTFTGHVTCQ